jgi:hypothetical protein
MFSTAWTLSSWVRITWRGVYLSAFFLCVCCSVHAEALRWADPPSKDTYQICKNSYFQALISNWNWPWGLTHKADEGAVVTDSRQCYSSLCKSECIVLQFYITERNESGDYDKLKEKKKLRQIWSKGIVPGRYVNIVDKQKSGEGGDTGRWRSASWCRHEIRNKL